MKRSKPISNIRQVHLLPKGMCCRRCANFRACTEEIVDLKGDEEICDFDPPRYQFRTNQGSVPATAAPDDV